MSKDKETTTGKNIVAVEEALSKTEHFIEKNQKIIMYVVGAIVVIIGGYMAFNKFYLAPKEKDAQSAIFWAEKYFEKDSLKLALNGDGTNLGFLDIIDEYGMTKTCDLAHYYVGMIYLKQGKFDDAIENLDDFSSDDQMVSAMAKGAEGDAYMELNDNEKALKYYLKAADMHDNAFTTPLFLMKAAFTYELDGNYTESLKLYERIQKDYYKSTEGREAEKYIARAKAKLGEK
jgi:tetratricopeptide (TPR) repeat protein